MEHDQKADAGFSRRPCASQKRRSFDRRPSEHPIDQLRRKPLRLTRRQILHRSALALAAPALAKLGITGLVRPAAAQTGRKWRHALSLFGDLKYPEGFKHFEYVNPNAPKGGSVRQVAFGTFDNFNTVV